MSFSSTPEFFINVKSIPDAESSEYKPFFLNELDKITYGVTINGIYIHGWLYFHLNHWHIYKDELDIRNNDIRRIFSKPDMRDNEWIIAEHLKTAEEQRKGLMIFGSRRLGKSESEASWVGRGATIYEGSENVIASTNEKDLGIVTGKIDKGLINLHPFFKHGRIGDDWKKEVVLGFKDKNDQRHEWSKVAIRNLNNGLNTEAFAGLTPKTLIIEEALEENELVYTKNGTKTIKEIQIGEEIFDDSGYLTTVIDKVNPGVVDLYEFTLSDGRKIKSSDNHVWKVYKNYLKRYEELTTKQIREKYYYLKTDKRYNNIIKKCFTFSLPKNSALQYDKKSLKIDPYWLGLWLGDGSKSTTSLCSIDDEIIDYCVYYAKKLKLNITIDWDLNKGGGKFRDCRIIKQIGKGSGNNNPLKDMMKEYNLLFNKHIPEDYLKSSVNDRMKLLQGLMDTDGGVDKKGHIEFTSARKELADGIKILLTELGINYSVSEVYKTYTSKGEKKTGKLTWRFQIYTKVPIFKLKRKLNNYNIPKPGRNAEKAILYKERITIVDIKYIGKAQAYCIKVDNDSKLFLTTNCIVTHNCGKSSWSECFEAAKPSFTSPFGWRATPWIVGTGGTLNAGSDAERYFKNPEHHNFIAVEFPNKKSKYGVFISGLHRMEGKVETTFGKYVEKNGILLPQDSELHQIPFFEKDDVKARAVIEEELQTALKNNDPKAYLKQRMYFPEDPDDCFLTEDGNDFPLEALREHLIYLESAQGLSRTVEFARDASGKVITKAPKPSHKLIENWPVEKNGIKNAPFLMLEDVMENAPRGLYCAGIDPYNQNQSANSTSLGTLCIYKRMYDPIGGTFNDMIVCTLASRPEMMKQWHEDVEMALEYYNASALPENEGGTLIQYFDSKNKAHMLVDGYSLARQINPKTTIQGRSKGLAATVANKNFYMNLMLEYTKEMVQLSTNSDGETVMGMGLKRILDPVLIKEMLGYRKGESNSDRIIAFGHALACNLYLNKVQPTIRIHEEEDTHKKEEIRIRSPFNLRRGHNPF